MTGSKRGEEQLGGRVVGEIMSMQLFFFFKYKSQLTDSELRQVPMLYGDQKQTVTCGLALCVLWVAWSPAVLSQLSRGYLLVPGEVVRVPSITWLCIKSIFFPLQIASP